MRCSVDEMLLRCTEHLKCLHGTLYCQCNICWEHSAQCNNTYTLNGESATSISEFRTMAMEGSIGHKRRLASNTEPTGNYNPHSTPKVRRETKVVEQQTSSRQCRSTAHENTHNTNTQLQVRSRTPSPNRIHPADPSGTRTRQEYYLHLLDEYLKSNDEKGLIEKFIDSYKSEIQTRTDNNTDAHTGLEVQSIRHEEYRTSDRCSDEERIRNNRDAMDGNSTSATLEMEGTNIDFTCGLRSGRKAHATKSNDAKKRNRKGKTGRGEGTITQEHIQQEETTTPGTSSQSDRIRGRSASPDDGQHRTRYSSNEKEETDGPLERDNVRTRLSTQHQQTTEKQYYTFIIHKTNQGPDWRNNRRNPPNFIAYDHGDHYHILYASDTGGGNAARQRNRILGYLRATPTGHSECLATHTTVKFLRNYILYCIRKGHSSQYVFGAKVNEAMNEAITYYNEMYIQPDGALEETLQHCRQYIEEKKIENKRISHTKINNITLMLWDMCEKYDLYTATDWEHKISHEEKVHLMTEYGLQVDSYIQRILRIRRQERTNRLKRMSLTEMMIITMEEYMQDREQADDVFLECVDWLIQLFTANDIDIIEFLAWNEIIKTQRYIKINAVVLQGPTNAGKSMIVEELLGGFCLEEICRERDNSGFHLDQLPFSVGVLFEEPCITPTNVGTWKLLFEGKPVKTDIKHKDKEGIPRLPIWVTTASKITANVDPNETSQIYQRIKLYVFKRSIEHRGDSYTKHPFTNNIYINRAPGIIGREHFSFIYLLYWSNIRDYIERQDKSHTIHRYFDYKTNTQTIREGTEEHNIQQNIDNRREKDSRGRVRQQGSKETDRNNSSNSDRRSNQTSIDSTSSSIDSLASQWQTALQAVWTTTMERSPVPVNEVNDQPREEEVGLEEALEDLLKMDMDPIYMR